MSFRILTEAGDSIITEDAADTLVYLHGFSSGITGFNDERVFGGYFGGRLKGTTVACPGDNANKVKSCC